MTDKNNTGLMAIWQTWVRQFPSWLSLSTYGTRIMVSLVAPGEHRPQTTCLHPATSSVLCCCLHLLPAVPETHCSHSFPQISFPDVLWPPSTSVALRCPLSPLHTSSLTPSRHVLLRQERGWWWWKRSGEKVHSKGNWCRDFESGCCQPVQISSSWPHIFFNRLQREEIHSLLCWLSDVSTLMKTK